MVAFHPSWFDVLSDSVRLELLHLLSKLGSATVAELMDGGHAGERTLRRHLDALVALGIVRKRAAASDGERDGRPATRYVLDARTRQGIDELFRVLERPLAPWPRRVPPPSAGR